MKLLFMLKENLCDIEREKENYFFKVKNCCHHAEGIQFDED
jgi:hypothetical protein